VIRLVILDIEGVLVEPGGSQYPWPLETLLDIRKLLADAPIACILCSGRQEPYGEAMVQALNLFYPLPDLTRERVRERSGLDLRSWPSILENGAYFYDPVVKRAIVSPLLEPESVAALKRINAEALQPLFDRTGAELEAGKDYSISVLPPPVEPGSPDRHSTDSFRPKVDAALRPFADQVEVKHSASAIDLRLAGSARRPR
jgi:hypothetical protein